LANNLYHFLISHFLDPADNQFYYQVARNGSFVPADWKNHKDLYSQSFAMFGLAQYSMTFYNFEAASHAFNLFKSIDAYTHDNVHGGYNETAHPSMIPCCLPDAAKDTNTHIHLLESITSLYSATHDETVRTRLEEMVNVILTKVLQPEHYLFMQFTMNWTIIGPKQIYFCHDLETVHLLLEAFDALEVPYNETQKDSIINMGVTSSTWGLLPGGGYAGFGVPNGTEWVPTETTREWWEQAEALNGNWWLYVLTGNTVYLDRMEKTMDFVEKYVWDSVYGEWYTFVDSSGVVQDSDKGAFWKAAYHTGRASQFLPKWIAKYQNKKLSL